MLINFNYENQNVYRRKAYIIVVFLLSVALACYKNVFIGMGLFLDVLLIVALKTDSYLAFVLSVGSWHGS